MINLVTKKFTLKPLPPTYFVGRRKQIIHILKSGLVDRSPTLLNLRGPQKIGRTSLLHYIHFLAQHRGKGTDYASIFEESGYMLSCPYIDLRLLSRSSAEDIKNTFVRVLVRLLAEQQPLEDLFGSIEISGITLFRLVDAMEKDSARRYILFIDRAEQLLDAQILEGIKDALGVLSDGVPNLGILLSFGASGELSARDVIHRTTEIDECIASISSLMNLVREDIDIGLLQQDEAYHFLMYDWYTKPNEPAPSPFSKEEVCWMLEMVGVHPYLLNLVGGLVWERKQNSSSSLTSAEMSQVEEQAQEQLKPFIANAWQRLSSLKNYQVRDLVVTLGSSLSNTITTPGVSDDTDLVTLLEGEGLAQNQGPNLTIPSVLLRKLILQQAKLDNTAFVDSDNLQDSTHKLILKKDGKLHSVAVTDLEAKIIDTLVNAPPDKLISNEELFEAIWEHTPPQEEDLRWQQRLTQRLSTLRKKLQTVLAENTIENVYGEGYRLTKVGRQSLQI